MEGSRPRSAKVRIFVWYEGKQTFSKIYVENDEALDDFSDDLDENDSVEYSLSSDEDEDELS